MTDPHCTRREFLRPLVRWTALSALLGAWAVAAKRSSDGTSCASAVPCQRCSAFRGCALPPARSARQHEIPVAPDSPSPSTGETP